jgi:hypothetical protein
MQLEAALAVVWREARDEGDAPRQAEAEAAQLDVKELYRVLSDTDMLPSVPKLFALQRRMGRLVMAPVAAQARRAALFGQGRKPGTRAWQDVARAIHDENPKATFGDIWSGLKRRTRRNDDVIKEVWSDDFGCSEKKMRRTCPAGYHIHWRSDDGRLHAVSARTIRNFISALRHKARTPPR